MRVHRCAGVIVYVLAIVGTPLLTVKLSSVLATQAIALSRPYFLDNSPCLPTLVEQRRIASAVAQPPTTEGSEKHVAALEAPWLSVDVLAAQMDLAEQENLAPAVDVMLPTRSLH
jgi:hypothetical protein